MSSKCIRPPKTFTRLRFGFALVETLVVLAIIGILVVIGIPALFRMFQNYQVKTATSQIAAQIRLARNNSVTQKAPHRVVIRNKDASSKINTYVVEFDPEDDTTFTTIPNLDFRLPPGVEIEDSPAFLSGIATINMDTRGVVTSNGTTPYIVDLKSPNGLTLRIRIHLSGSVEIQTL